MVIGGVVERIPNRMIHDLDAYIPQDGKVLLI